jgi:hypothetical protein
MHALTSRRLLTRERSRVLHDSSAMRLTRLETRRTLQAHGNTNGPIRQTPKSNHHPNGHRPTSARSPADDERRVQEA